MKLQVILEKKETITVEIEIIGEVEGALGDEVTFTPSEKSFKLLQDLEKNGWQQTGKVVGVKINGSRS